MADPIRDFRLSESGEWDTSDGKFDVVAGQAAVEQNVRVRVRMFQGECFLDEAVGVDYLGSVLIKNPDELLIRATIAERIASVPDVTDVFGAKLERDTTTRDASISYQIDSVYSEQPFAQTITVPGV